MNEIGRRYELPKESVSRVAALQQEYQSQANAIRAQSKSSLDDRSVRLNALASQARSRIGTFLGASVFEAYKESSGFNNWFKLSPGTTTGVKEEIALKR